jgi:hypothetical protein
VAQRQVLDGELAVAAEEEGEKPKQVEQECNHRAGIVAGSGPTDQPLGRRMRFWQWTMGTRPRDRSRPSSMRQLPGDRHRHGSPDPDHVRPVAEGRAASSGRRHRDRAWRATPWHRYVRPRSLRAGAQIVDAGIAMTRAGTERNAGSRSRQYALERPSPSVISPRTSTSGDVPLE